MTRERSKQHILFFLLTLAVLSACADDPSATLRERLVALDGVVVTQIAPPDELFSEAYILDISQPKDHENPEAGSFSQRVYLHHVDEALPLVLNTRGYTGSEAAHELALLAGINQVTVTGRYYEHSVPDSQDWQYLSIEQQSHDYHRILQLLKPLYPDKWLTTGTSKGGMNALFYRYHYPDDIDATVVYGAPIMFGLEDPRFDEFVFGEVATSECRAKIIDFQRLALINKDALLLLLDLDPEAFRIPLARALEYSVLEYPTAFWQYAPSDCETIPTAESSVQAMAEHLQLQSNVGNFSRSAYVFFSPGFVQLYNELGYYGYRTEHLSDLLDNTEHSPVDFVPESGKRAFDPQKMQEISEWLTNEAEHVIYVYGGQDPYTAARVDPREVLSSFSLIQPGADHRVLVQNLDRRAQVGDTLEAWLGVDLGFTP